MKPIYFLLKHAYRRGFIYSLLLSFALFLVMIGCSTDTLDENIMETLTRSEADFNGSKTIASDTGRIVLGAVEPDVYTVEAMRAAYNQLYPNGGAQYGPDAIRTTHLYVRFRPKNDEEYQSIIRYDLSDIPLNVEITRGGSYYHDPSIPEDQYTWQYAVVPQGELNTTVEYEVLKELYMEPEASGSGGIGMPGAAGPSGESELLNFWDKLESASLSIAAGENVAPDSESGQQGAPAKAKWTPYGNIKVYDDLLKQEIPLVNATVIVWKNTRKSTIRTNGNGDYVADKRFEAGHSLSYRIKWECGGKFTIFDGGFYHQASLYSEGRKFGSWNKVIGQTDYKQKQLATIYRAADRAFNGNKDYLDMRRPDFGGQIAIRYVEEYDKHQAGWFRGYFVTSGLFPAIKMWPIYEGGAYYETDIVFGKTSHELGHANHYSIFKKFFKDFAYDAVNNKLCESWGDAVEYYIMKKEYGELGRNIDSYETLPPYVSPGMPGMPTTAAAWKPGMPGLPGSVTFIKPAKLNRQSWPYDDMSKEEKTDHIWYSSLIIDLVDDNNQAEYYRRKYKTSVLKVPRDKVTGFTLSQIQSALSNVITMEQFKNKIKEQNKKLAKPNSEADIDILFNDHIKHWVK